MKMLINLHGAIVNVEIQNDHIRDRIVKDFQNSGAYISFNEFSSIHPTVRLFSTSEIENKEDYERVNLYASSLYGYVKENKHVILTKNPLTLTLLNGKQIDMINLEPTIDFNHLHHLIRYPLRNQLEDKGCNIIHGSSISFDGQKGAIFLGQKGAGKTTVMAELLSSGAYMIGNDSIFVVKDNEELVVKSWPQIIRIGKGTIDNNIHLREKINDVEHSYAADEKIEIYSEGMNYIFDRKLVLEKAIITTFFNVRFIKDYNGIDVTPILNEKQINQIISERILNDRQEIWMPGWKWIRNDIDIKNLVEVIRSSTKLYDVTVGGKCEGWGNGQSDLPKIVSNLINN